MSPRVREITPHKTRKLSLGAHLLVCARSLWILAFTAGCFLLFAPISVLLNQASSMNYIHLCASLQLTVWHFANSLPSLSFTPPLSTFFLSTYDSSTFMIVKCWLVDYCLYKGRVAQGLNSVLFLQQEINYLLLNVLQHYLIMLYLQLQICNYVMLLIPY